MGSRSGFALAASLMVLALLSVLGAAAIQSTTVEVKISAHDRDARTALVLAEAALEEARYYTARAWGKIAGPTSLPPSSVRVTVTTPLPPGTPWAADLYRGFTLHDRAGRAFTVEENTDLPAPRITVSAPGGVAPAEGRFFLVREIPSAAVSGTRLSVGDDAWAGNSPPGTWAGWTLWDADGVAYRVVGSDRDLLASPARVLLDLSAEPGPAPYRLGRNPWVSALASGSAPLGDAVSGTPDAWDRAFALPSGAELGRAEVRAEGIGPGEYRLVSVGRVGTSRGRAEAQVHRAGLPTQRVADWKVGDDE